MKIRTLAATHRTQIHPSRLHPAPRTSLQYASLFALLCALSLPALACQISLPRFSESAPDGSVLFQDNFSEPESGWKGTFDSEDGFVGYFDGTYRFLVSKPERMVWSGPDLDLSDARIEVDALKRSGPEDDDFGMVCRAKDEANFYFFVISSDGYYGIGKTVRGVQSLIGAQGMLPSEKIRQGIMVNHLRVDCMKNELAFYVNGVLLARVQDGSFSAGGAGLLAGTFDQPGNEVLFDNFSVLNP